MRSIAILPIGTEWDPQAKEELEQLLAKLPDDIEPTWLDPISDAPQDAPTSWVGPLSGDMKIEARAWEAADWCGFMVLAAMHGGTARAITYAALSSGLPVAIWRHNKRHSMASSSLAAEALRQLGHPHILIQGNDDYAAGRLSDAARGAVRAEPERRPIRIGWIGPTHPNLISAMVNPLMLTRRFGVWVVPISISSLRERVDQIGPERVEKTLAEFGEQFAVTAPTDMLPKAAALHLALADFAWHNRLRAIAIDCWSEMVPTFGVSPCLGFAACGSAGASPSPIIACEGDLVLAFTLLTGAGISGGPGYVGDFYSFDPETGRAVLMHCAGCAGLHGGAEKMEIAAQKPPGTVGEKGTVVACRPVLPNGPGVVALLHGEDLDRLHLRSCDVVRTSFEDQMQVEIQVHGDPRSFADESAGNHYVVFPGASEGAWRQWAEWSGVEVH